MAAKELQDTSLRDDANLKAYFRMESAVAEVGGITLSNTGSVAFNSGKFNNAADFGNPNTGKYLNAATTFGITVDNAKTISAWLYLPAALAGADTYPRAITWAYAANQVFYGMCYVRSGGTNQLWMGRGRSGISDDIVSVANPATGQWLHTVMTYSGSTVTAYLNGSSVGTKSSSGDGSGSFFTQDALTLGVIQAGTTTYQSCMVDDLAIFSRALTGDEVAALYNGTLGGRVSGAIMFGTNF